MERYTRRGFLKIIATLVGARVLSPLLRFAEPLTKTPQFQKALVATYSGGVWVTENILDKIPAWRHISGWR